MSDKRSFRRRLAERMLMSPPIIHSGNSMTQNSSKSRFELVVDLIKAMAWPLIVIAMLISFWRPLRSVADQLPTIISRSETITVAGLSIKLGKELSRPPSDEVKQALSKLSADGVRRLLNSSGATYWDKGSESYGKGDFAELLKLGLAEEVPASELNDPNRGRKYGYGVRLTEFGKETQGFLFELISQFVQELSR